MSKLILVVLCLIVKFSFSQDLKEIFKNTDSFFEHLILKYESTDFTEDVKVSIDHQIKEYLKVALKQTQELKIKNKGIGVLDGFEEILHSNTTNHKDMLFFKRYRGYEQWFGVTLTSSEIIIYQVVGSTFVPVTFYPIENAVKIYTLKYYGQTMFIVQKSQSIIIFYFYSQDNKFVVHNEQSLNTSCIIGHLNPWNELDQLFIGASCPSEILVYSKQNDKFELLAKHLLDLEYLIPIQSQDSTLFVVSGPQRTLILKYLVESGQFALSQSIQRSFIDGAAVQMKKKLSQAQDSFLALTSFEETIVYKQSMDDNIFSPFQQIEPADRIIFIKINETILLILLKSDALSLYQYDGWRFIKLNFKLDQVKQMNAIIFNNEEKLLVWKDDKSWSLYSLKWMVEEPAIRNEEIKQWCFSAKERAKIMLKSLPQNKNPVHIDKEVIRKLTVTNDINGLSIDKMKNLTNKYNNLADRLTKTNEHFIKQISIESPHFQSLQAQTIHVKCSKNCWAKNLITTKDNDIFSKLQKVNDESQNLKFEQIKIHKLDGFPCPTVGVQFKEVEVKGLVNGRSLDDLQNNVLKTSGNQTVTGQLFFTNLEVNSLQASNVDIASSYTRQKIITEKLYAKELILTEGGMLLPLDGEPVTMTGTLTATKVKFNGLINLQGGIKGNSRKRLAPMVHFHGNYALNDNYTLANLRVRNILSVSDLSRSNGKSLKEIVDKAISLDTDVPVKLILKKNQTLWSNVTVKNLPNWLTRKNAQNVKVTGKKIALNTVTLSDTIYSNLPIPKIEANTCSIGAITPDIRTSTIIVGEATAKLIESDSIYGAKELEHLIADSVTSLNDVDLSRKKFTGFIHVKNINMSRFENSPFHTFENLKFKWYQPDIFEGSVTVQDLKVNELAVKKGIKIPSPDVIRNIIVEGNLQVKTINGIDFDALMKNIVFINDSTSFNKVSFEGSLEVNEIEAINSNIHVRNVEPNTSLGNKIILGDLIIENDLSAPNIFSTLPADEVTTYLVDGSIRFKNEPIVENINGKNLQELISNVWMLNRPSNLTGHFHFNGVNLTQTFNSYKILHTPNFGPWQSLKSRLLSKTRLQEISVPTYFRIAKISNICSSGNSTLNSSDLYLNDFIYTTLKNNKNQSVKDKWHFNRLTITDNLSLFGKMNNLNLSTDVARYDVEKNRVTGQKTVDKLTARNLVGLHFGEWVKDALMQVDNDKPLIIKGKKTFNIFNARLLNVNGTVKGKMLEHSLLKFGDQTIKVPKVVKGSLFTPSLMSGGFINNVNLHSLIRNQLSDILPSQNVQSKFKFKKNVTIMGNVTISGKFYDVNLNLLNTVNETYAPVLNNLKYFKPFVKGIKDAVTHRAKYWYAFECVTDDISLNGNNTMLTNEFYTSYRFNLSNCILKSIWEVVCDENKSFNLKAFTNSSEIVINQILSAEAVPIVVQIGTGLRSRITIHKYNYVTDSFEVSASIRAPGITQASVRSVSDVIWIVSRTQSEMLITRFELWGDLQKYHLPDSYLLALDVVPATNELVLVRDDGMWKLDGLAGPQNVYNVILKADSVETFVSGEEFFVKVIYRNNETMLLKARYKGV